MTVKEMFDLRKQGKIEEAYDAIRPIYAVHKGRYTTLCMFWTASDIFKKRLDEKRIDEAKKIFLALKRMLPSVDDPDQKAEGFLQYAASCLIKESSAISAGQEKDSSNSCDSCSEEKSHLCSLNAPQQKVLDHIRSHPGVSVPKLNAELGIPSKSIERHIASLTKNTLIEHRGSKKTGGYYPL